MKKKSLLALLMLSCISSFAQKETETSYYVNAIGNTINIDGHQIVYYLPQNLLTVNLEFTQISKAKGPYAEFAEKYLNITSDIITEDGSQFLIKKVNVKRYAVPDTAQLYALNFTGQEYLPMVQLSTNSTILACNSHHIVDDPNFATPETNFNNNIEPIQFLDLGVKPFIFEEEDTEDADNDSISNVKNEPKMIVRTPEECAAEAAAFIRKIRKRRLKLIAGISGEANNADGDAIRTMIKNLNNLENEYLQLFIGKTVKNTYKQAVTLIPNSNQNEQQIIGYFSEIEGFSTTKKSNSYPITLKITSITSVPKVDIKAVETSAKSTSNVKYGIYYRIPATVKISIDCDGLLQHAEQMVIAQKGYVVPLPADYLNNHKYAIEFDAETGALKRISGN